MIIFPALAIDEPEDRRYFFPILGFGDSRYQPLKRDIATSY